MSHARDQVFSLPELVSAILLHLPLEDLLVNAPLVCRSFYKITQTPILQQALFFQPIPSNRKSYFNPLLQERFPAWFGKYKKNTAPKNGTGRGIRGGEFKSLHWNESERTREVYAREEASWRRMLPVQPPATVFEVNAASHYQMGSDYQKGKVGFVDGVRMGTLYDYAMKTVAIPISSFGVQWHMMPRVGDEGEGDDRGGMAGEREKVTMYTSYTFQCCIGMPSSLGPEFKSEGFQELDITFEVSAPNRSSRLEFF